MIGFVLGGVAAMGGAVFMVLDEPAVKDRRRHRRISATLLAVSAVMLLLGLLGGITRSF